MSALEFLECLPCILAFSALAGVARWYLSNSPKKKVHCLGEMVCSVLAGAMAYGFLYNHDIRNGLLFMGSLAGAYLSGDLLNKVKIVGELKLRLPEGLGFQTSEKKKESRVDFPAEVPTGTCCARPVQHEKRKRKGKRHD